MGVQLPPRTALEDRTAPAEEAFSTIFCTEFILAAIRALKCIEHEQRSATPEERPVLTRFAGFGPVAQQQVWQQRWLPGQTALLFR